MYEELVRALRECEFCNTCGIAVDGKCKFGGRDAMEVAAADAIEYLILQNEMAQHAIRGLDATCNGLLKENERLKEGYEAWKRDEEYKEWLLNDRPCPDFAREE